VGVDQADSFQAAALAIDHNNLTMMGGSYLPEDLAGMYDPAGYRAVLDMLLMQEVPLISHDEEDLAALLGLIPPPEASPILPATGELITVAAPVGFFEAHRDIFEQWRAAYGDRLSISVQGA
jgi:hypothetical protein